MKDYLKQLDNILLSANDKVLEGSGKVSHKDAIKKAKQEYKKYQVNTISSVEKEYLNVLKEVNGKITK